jgi:beta-glucosidase/6-phospho-beta-glucosidase/beta-galactosidase
LAADAILDDGLTPARALDGAPDAGFMFATGIECSNPTIEGGRVRRDLLAECGHYDRYREDFALVRRLGLRFLRYGLPNHLVHLGPGRYDWSFADAALGEMRRLGIRPILDLTHFGAPDWIGDFQNPDFARHLAEYAGAVAARYPWVRHYTPVNEIFVTARLSAKEGLWNEQLRTDRGFVTALKHLTEACIRATEAIVRQRPDAVIVHSESAEFIHQARLAPSAAVTLANKQRFISLDLLFGHAPCAEIAMYLLDNGLTRAEYDWFMRTEPAGHQVLGLDYYGRNEHIMTPSGRRIPCEDVMGWHLIAREYFDRYRKPLMHTETNVLEAAQAPAWLWKQWINIMRMRRDGVPVLGFTWYSLTDQVDWDIALAELRGKVNGCGLYDLARRPNPVAEEYRALIAEFAPLRGIPESALFETALAA